MAFTENSYVEQRPDGSFVAVVNGQAGAPMSQAQAEQSFNERTGQSNAAPTITGGGGGGTYNTADGRSLTLQQMLAGLDSAAGGTWTGGDRTNPQAVLAAFNAAGRPSGGGTAAGGGGVAGYESFNSAAYNYTLAAATAAADAAYKQKRLELIDLPMLEIEKERLAQQARNDTYSRAIAEANVTGYYTPVSSVTAPSMSSDAALDAIWAKRPDLGPFYQQNGWDVSTPEKQRAAVKDWLGMTNEESIRAAGGDPLKAAKALGIDVGGGTATTAGERQKTLAREQYETSTGLNALNLSASLRGPRNAFQQQAVNAGINEQGLNKYTDMIAGRYNVPAFQAPQAAVQPATLQTMAEDINTAANGLTPAIQGAVNSVTNAAKSGVDQILAGGGTSGTRAVAPTAQNVANAVSAAGSPTFTAPGAAPTVQQYTNALPAPNKINWGDFSRMPQSARDFMLSAYEKAGYDANDVLGQAQAAGSMKTPGVRAGTIKP
jgi:hypothetical protein